MKLPEYTTDCGNPFDWIIQQSAVVRKSMTQMNADMRAALEASRPVLPARDYQPEGKYKRKPTK